MNTLLKKCVAECFGTFVLVFMACGTAVYSSMLGVTFFVIVPLAFGLVIVAMAYSIGNISGCHINPAVSLAMAIRKEITWKEFGAYVAAQCVGAFVGAALLAAFLRNFEALGGNAISGFLRNGEGKLDAWSYLGAFLAEVILTCIFVFAILGVTDSKFGNGKLGGLVIGLTLTLVHILGLYLTGTSVNPARSLAPAILQLIDKSTESAEQLWIWILGPFAGGALAALLYSFLFGKKDNSAASDNAQNMEKEESAE